MSTVDEIKAAALRLPENEQVGLYRWLDEAEAVRRWKLADLQRAIQKGLDSLERGEGVPLDADEIKREGRRRLAALRSQNA